MKKINEKDILKLRMAGNVKDEAGGNLKSVLPFVSKKEAATKRTSEERQTKAMEDIVTKLADILKANDKNAVVLMDMLRKVIIRPEVKLPEFPKFPAFPKPVASWNFEIERDSQGFIETVKAVSGVK